MIFLKIYEKICKKFPKITDKIIMNSWYWYVNKMDKDADAIFMNYGFSSKNKIKLNKEDKTNRYQIQLYDFTVSHEKIKDKSILEIGSGRGGGASYIARYLKPKKIIGLDLCKRSIKFCKKHYKSKNLDFIQGNSQELPFKDETFDIIINVESSHGYPNFSEFLNESYRVLKKGGSFLIADFRYKKEVNDLINKIKKSKFKLTKQKDITKNVFGALVNDDKRKKHLVKKIMPKFFKKEAEQFAGTKDSELYNSFKTEKRKYLFFKLIKK